MKQKLLTAKGDELSRLLGEVLQPETKEHTETDKYCEFKCLKCGVLIYSIEDNYTPAPCTVADPIPLYDWNEAMKWRNWAVAEYGEVKFKQAMIDVYSTTTERLRINFSSWLALYAQPEHYLIAAALCKLKGNEDE